MDCLPLTWPRLVENPEISVPHCSRLWRSSCSFVGADPPAKVGEFPSFIYLTSAVLLLMVLCLMLNSPLQIMSIDLCCLIL
jgi:hypothetical protein